MFEVIILAIIQGITEFLPISSSSHLIIFSELTDFKFKGLEIDISVHSGSLFAVLLYFKNYFYNLRKNFHIFGLVLISSLPTMVIGFFIVKFDLIEHVRNIEIIIFTTIFFAIFLFTVDKRPQNKNLNQNFNIKSAVKIGLFQTLSLIPGVSRSGIVISICRLLCFSREDSAKIAFLLSIPTLAAVSIFSLHSIYQNGDIFITKINLYAFFMSFIFSFITIKYLLVYLKKFTYTFFVIYRILLGLMLLLYVFSS